PDPTPDGTTAADTQADEAPNAPAADERPGTGSVQSPGESDAAQGPGAPASDDEDGPGPAEGPSPRN
ncbi:hypothetical protein L2W11_16185, partial [Sediminivirga luteola]|nr:hypothetical protein [Sediminivirga luteola]